MARDNVFMIIDKKGKVLVRCSTIIIIIINAKHLLVEYLIKLTSTLVWCIDNVWTFLWVGLVHHC